MRNTPVQRGRGPPESDLRARRHGGRPEPRSPRGDDLDGAGAVLGLCRCEPAELGSPAAATCGAGIAIAGEGAPNGSETRTDGEDATICEECTRCIYEYPAAEGVRGIRRHSRTVRR